MSSEDRRVPSSSQTVGPYFRIGLEYLIDRMAEITPGSESPVEIRGKVLDRDGAPVPDAMLEFWNAGGEMAAPPEPQGHGIPDRFRRVRTASDGSFTVTIARPVAGRLEDGSSQAPHATVLVFARGLQRHLITRVYLEDEAANDTDPVLLSVPDDRRGTLTARHDSAGIYWWNVILQGAEETVFFAW